MTMSNEFAHHVFLSHSAKDKAVVRPLAERLRKDRLKVWFDEWEIKPGDSIPAKIEEGLEHSRVLVLCMSANAFGSDWAQMESGTFRFRDPLNQERRFIPLRLDDAPIKGSLAQFHYINWYPDPQEQEYEKLLEACQLPANPTTATTLPMDEGFPTATDSKLVSLKPGEDYLIRRRDMINQVFSAFEGIHVFFFNVCIDYLSLVEVLHAGLTATDADRTRYFGYIKEIGQRFREMHILEDRLRVAGFEPAVQSMQQYRLQAIEVNDMLQLQQPRMQKSDVNALTEQLFRRKDRLYKELAKALRAGSSGEVKPDRLESLSRLNPAKV